MTNEEKQARYAATVGENMKRVQDYYRSIHGEGHVKNGTIKSRA